MRRGMEMGGHLKNGEERAMGSLVSVRGLRRRRDSITVAGALAAGSGL